ncbi:MAG: 16S rRNA (cytosine(967)-C(5))-methyltransferase RsmB [Thiomargarita sp.]|nr:16S rRNA (cytosine(967)-C(5))-methyltransferase RsmB [Thiomargarita sp.]
MNSRSLATQILVEVIIHRHSLSDCLENNLTVLKDSRDRALTKILCYGVLRWQIHLEDLLSQLLSKPLKTKDQDIHLLLLIGLYQQLYLRIPDHAAVSETVNVTKNLEKNWAKGLVNAVLRNFQRQQTTLLAKINAKAQIRLSHPLWLFERLKQEWSEQWEQVMQANNQHPPLTLRVNQRIISRNDYLTLLQKNQLTATIVPYTTNGIILENTDITKGEQGVTQLPGFKEGWISVQDGAAQIAATLLDIPTDANVLDACAAPGGKTAHLLEQYEIKTLVAIDNKPNRITKLTETLQRLNLSAIIKCADIKDHTWWDGKLFDRILLDAPCSATGVIRRHPDIKYLRQADDIKKMAIQQQQLLESLWKLLKSGGGLLYVTCSVLAEENHLQIANFLKIHSDAQERKIVADWGHTMPHGRQILPGENNMDGFYYAYLTKE